MLLSLSLVCFHLEAESIYSKSKKGLFGKIYTWKFFLVKEDDNIHA